MDAASLPHIIHVHEQGVDSPKTPTMIDYKLDETGFWHCNNCNAVNNTDDGRCGNCCALGLEKQSLENGFDKSNARDYKNLNTKKRFNIGFLVTGETYQYPKIRVEDEEGVSVHSFSESLMDVNSSSGEGDNLDRSLIQRSVTPLNDLNHESFKSMTDLQKRNTLEESGPDDAKSFNSNITEMVCCFRLCTIHCCILNI